VIEQGSFVYIQGSNSTGKSLFLSSIYGEYPNFKGNLYLRNIKVSEHKLNNNIFLLDDDLSVIDKFTFLQHLELPYKKLSIHQKNRIIEMATIVGMIDILNIKAKYISKSEKMLMFIIRAALISPYLLMIDDLDFYFDNEVIKKVYQLFLYCLKSGMIIIATGKTNIKNVPLYRINSGLLEKICPSIGF